MTDRRTRGLAAAVAMALLAPGCHRRRDLTTELAGPTDALLERSWASATCGRAETRKCDDVDVWRVRCEIARRAATDKALKDRLLADARDGGAAARGAALRTLVDFRDEPSLDVATLALNDDDPKVACAAAEYGIWFRRTTTERLNKLTTICDNNVVVKVTADMVSRSMTQPLIKTGATCAEQTKLDAKNK